MRFSRAGNFGATIALAACFMALVSLHPAAAQKAAPPQAAQKSAPPQAAQDATHSAEAKALLLRMADHLAKAQSFSVKMEAGYDVVQESGQKIEFLETRSILLNRPDDLRIDVERGTGEKEQVFFDGKNVTLFNPKENIFATLEKPGSVDDIIYYIVGELQTRIPLSLLLVTTLPEEMQGRVTDIAVVGDVTIGGQTTVHIAARTDYVDFQVWVAGGDQPVPVRAVLTYKHSPGQPQFWAMLRDWNFQPKLDPDAFTFVPPPNAERVAFMVPAPRNAGQSKVRR